MTYGGIGIKVWIYKGDTLENYRPFKKNNADLSVTCMLFPKKVKHRKWQTDRKDLSKKVATRGTKLQFGSFGLRSLTGSRVFSNQIEAARKVVSRTLGKTGRYWIRIFPTDLLPQNLQR
jgi:ribosomal protein L16/L10AE